MNVEDPTCTVLPKSARALSGLAFHIYTLLVSNIDLSVHYAFADGLVLSVLCTTVRSVWSGCLRCSPVEQGPPREIDVWASARVSRHEYHRRPAQEVARCTLRRGYLWREPMETASARGSYVRKGHQRGGLWTCGYAGQWGLIFGLCFAIVAEHARLNCVGLMAEMEHRCKVRTAS